MLQVVLLSVENLSGQKKVKESLNLITMSAFKEMKQEDYKLRHQHIVNETPTKACNGEF